VTRDGADLGEAGFDDAAARALALADTEARQLGHDRVGTEHVLLGLLTNGSAASRTLTEAGVTLTAARNKVSEAVGESAPARRLPNGPLPRTPRVARALGRSSRFAHARGSELVTSEHVLMGVLDVEGIAGQVLRGLGVDVDALRGSLETTSQSVLLDVGDDAARPNTPERPVAVCPSCRSSLDDGLVHRAVTARGDDGTTRAVTLLLCGACGHVVGASTSADG
jgi:ATP-dependent Clp protease ATP-binding subunit ClpC